LWELGVLGQDDWLTVLTAAQPSADRDTTSGQARRTLVLAILRGALLDLLATGDLERTSTAVSQHAAGLHAATSTHADSNR